MSMPNLLGMKSFACEQLDNHNACKLLRRGVVPHSHIRKTGKGEIEIAEYACPTCGCNCICHDRETLPEYLSDPVRGAHSNGGQ